MTTRDEKARAARLLTPKELERWKADQAANELVLRPFLPLKGRAIVSVRSLTPRELAAYGWSPAPWECALVLILDDGTALVPSCDPEGNGPGSLFIEETQTVGAAEAGRAVEEEARQHAEAVHADAVADAAEAGA